MSATEPAAPALEPRRSGGAGPAPEWTSCSTCHRRLDGLRAKTAAIFDGRLSYFCDRACKHAFRRQPPPSVELDGAQTGEHQRPAGALALRPERPLPTSMEAPLPGKMRDDSSLALLEPLARRSTAPSELGGATAVRRDLAWLLLALTLIAGILTTALELGSDTRLLRVVRVLLSLVGAVTLAGCALSRSDEAMRSHWFAVAGPPFAAAGLAVVHLVWTWGTPEASGSLLYFLTGVVIGCAALGAWLVGAASEREQRAREGLRARLNLPARRMVGDSMAGINSSAAELSEGQRVHVELNEVVPADMVVTDGEAEVALLAGSGTTLRYQPGDVVAAGGRVIRGRFEGLCNRVGDQRALVRCLLANALRPDLHARLARLGRALAVQGALALAALAAAVGSITERPGFAVAMMAVGVYAAFSNMGIAHLASVAIARGVRIATARGASYRDAEGWERAAQTTVVVFCARGTLVRGEPELSEVEVIAWAAKQPQVHAEDLLGLVAGVFAGRTEPAAVALRRAAKTRNVAPKEIRNRRVFSCGGVAAVSASGETVVVGSRSLLMDRHISVAAAERSIFELEREGRSVFLIARAGRLLGFVALQDGLRVGARGAVQHILDGQMEPVLMSADTRETCEALGRALDIEHLRPEVRDGDAAAAIRGLQDAGAKVAVIGHAGFDDEALQAADCSVALAAAGSAEDSSHVAMLDDDVRGAALALALAQQTQREAQTVSSMVLGPGALATLLAVVGLMPPVFAPAAQVVGTVVAVLYLRRSRRTSA